MSTPHPSAEATSTYIRTIRERVGEIVVGQNVVVERTLIALLTSGHLLLEGMPGLAKTLLVNTIAQDAIGTEADLVAAWKWSMRFT